MASVYRLALGQLAGTAPGPPFMALKNSNIEFFQSIQDNMRHVNIYNTASLSVSHVCSFVVEYAMYFAVSKTSNLELCFSCSCCCFCIFVSCFWPYVWHILSYFVKSRNKNRSSPFKTLDVYISQPFKT